MHYGSTSTMPAQKKKLKMYAEKELNSGAFTSQHNTKTYTEVKGNLQKYTASIGSVCGEETSISDHSTD